MEVINKIVLILRCNHWYDFLSSAWPLLWQKVQPQDLSKASPLSSKTSSVATRSTWRCTRPPFFHLFANTPDKQIMNYQGSGSANLDIFRGRLNLYKVLVLILTIYWWIPSIEVNAILARLSKMPTVSMRINFDERGPQKTSCIREDYCFNSLSSWGTHLSQQVVFCVCKGGFSPNNETMWTSSPAYMMLRFSLLMLELYVVRFYVATLYERLS